jgi:hypothetical protein
MAITRLNNNSASSITSLSGLTSLPSGLVGDNTPAFKAQVSSNRGPFSANTWTDIPFGTEQFDTNNAFNGTTFTIPETGKYLFTVQLRVEQLATNLYYQVKIDGASQSSVATIATAGFDETTSYFPLGFSVILNQNQNDNLKVQLFQGGNATSYVHTESWFGACKLIT